MDMSTASPMEPLSTDDSMEKERKKESINWMLETRSEGGIMNYGVTPSESPSLLPPRLDGWSDEAYEA